MKIMMFVLKLLKKTLKPPWEISVLDLESRTNKLAPPMMDSVSNVALNSSDLTF